MQLQKEIISKLAVMFGHSEIMDISVNEKTTTIKAKDLNDSYFYNNFESEYTYKGMDDEKRIVTHTMDNVNGFINGTGIHVHGMKSVEDIKSEGREIDARILANYETLKKLNRRA